MRALSAHRLLDWRPVESGWELSAEITGAMPEQCPGAMPGGRPYVLVIDSPPPPLSDFGGLRPG